MFQTFDATTSPEQGPPRLAALRDAFLAEGFDGFIIPRADAHQGEYVADCDDRLAWLTGFTGSAGFCIALKDRAGVFVDGRYRVQVKAQVDTSAFTPVNWPETQAGPWLKDALPKGGRVAFDATLHTISEIRKLRNALDGSGIDLVPSRNFVDAIWTDRPAPPSAPVKLFPGDIAGMSSAEKRELCADTLRKSGQGAAILTLPDGINWLLNIRGQDIPRNPIVQANAILFADGKVKLFLAADRVPAEVMSHLGPDVELCEKTAFSDEISRLDGKIRVDETSAPFAIAELAERHGLNLVAGSDPTVLPKARKTPAEIAATTEAHLRDGAAMVEFLAWFDAEVPGGSLTEIDVVTKLEGFRRATNALQEISFETICGAGPNGALPHYRVTTETNRELENGQLVVIDSGGQYLDGTTDITRTVGIGEVGEEEKAAFTRVLQGMIAISRLRWPKGLSGGHIDALARYPLWLAGQDYDHGTGHGVGVYLSVHEGPARISRVSDVPLEPGMILSNEPGYYREGAFGIRTENLIVVGPAPDLPGADDREMLAFRTLTWVPIDRRLILGQMLTEAERDWLNAYHAEVLEKISPRVSEPARLWLQAATKPL